MDAQDDRPVIVMREGAVATVTLNEPKTMNALSPSIRAALEESLPALINDPAVRAIIVTGQGRAFCAGGDIRAMDDRDTVTMRRRMQRVYRWLMPLLVADKPVITAVNGFAVGAGFSLALAGDLVCASHDARFRAGFPGIAAAPDLSLAYSLPRVVGMLHAKDILMTNREIDAQEAQAIGLVNRLAEPDRLMEVASSLAAELAEGPTVAHGLAKQLLRRAYDGTLESFLELEAMAQTTAFGSADFAEGIEAFREKRKPKFKGR